MILWLHLDVPYLFRYDLLRDHSFEVLQRPHFIVDGGRNRILWCPLIRIEFVRLKMLITLLVDLLLLLMSLIPWAILGQPLRLERFIQFMESQQVEHHIHIRILHHSTLDLQRILHITHKVRLVGQLWCHWLQILGTLKVIHNEVLMKIRGIQRQHKLHQRVLFPRFILQDLNILNDVIYINDFEDIYSSWIHLWLKSRHTPGMGVCWTEPNNLMICRTLTNSMGGRGCRTNYCYMMYQPNPLDRWCSIASRNRWFVYLYPIGGRPWSSRYTEPGSQICSTRRQVSPCTHFLIHYCQRIATLTDHEYLPIS